MDSSATPRQSLGAIEVVSATSAFVQFEAVKRHVEEFQKALDNEHDVGLLLTNFGKSVMMEVTSISYSGEALMVFKGIVSGREATLVQHVTQLSFLMTSVRKEPEKPHRTIGFSVD